MKIEVNIERNVYVIMVGNEPVYATKFEKSANKLKAAYADIYPEDKIEVKKVEYGF